MVYNPFYYKDTWTRVCCGTVHNSKDLEPTQMPIIGKLVKENAAQKYTMEYCAAIKRMGSGPLQGHG